MMRPGIVAAAAACLLIAGCFGGASVPDELLTLTPAEMRPADAPRTAGPGEAVTVAEPGVPQALNTNRIPVYVGPNAIQYIKDAQWVDDPASLFARVVAEAVAVRTGRVVLDPGQYSHDPGTRITGQLTMFGLDPDRMEAVVVYDAAMASGPTGVATNRFEARVPVAEASGAAMAPALNQAANQVAAQVAEWVGAR